MHRLLVIPAAVLLVIGVPATSARAGVSFGTIEEAPEVTHEKWKKSAEEAYKQGMEARAAGKKADAVKFLMRAYQIGRRMRIESPYPQKAADALAVLSEEGIRELDVARDLISGEAPDAGLLELKRIMRTYLGLPPAKLAGALRRQLEKDPGFQARLRASHLAEQLARAKALEAKAAALAETPPDEPAAAGEGEAGGGASQAAGEPDPPAETDSAARPSPGASAPGSDGAGRRARRLDLLAEAHAIYVRVAEAGKGTDVGKQAEASRRRLEADADLMARIRRARLRDQARQWLSLGLNYMRAGRMDTARSWFEKVLAECPDTPQAREARGYLEGMTK